jgi:tRNA G26 N,N-dimethylase Trm1
MEIEITMVVDTICRAIAAISIILCVFLHYYDRHKTSKWLKENSKDDAKEDIIKFIKDNCRDCNEVDREMYENCEQCGFLKKFLENKGGNKLK